MKASPTSPSIVLVHGGFVDGSGWQKVFNHLSSAGYEVSIVQIPTLTLADDVAFTNRVVSGRPGKVLLVGHSYGGVVITEAGTHSKVAGLVYVAAFAPDSGESVAKLLADPPPGASAPPILPPQDGFLLLDPARFAEAFAADIPAADAAFMAASQVPWGVVALSGEVSVPAWKVKPSWYVVSSDDRMIPPPAQRAMAQRAGSAVSEVAASHSLFISRAAEVAAVIAQAAESIASL